MKRSKLDKYISVLESLISKPLEFEEISYNTNLGCTILKRYLALLISHDLVVEQFSTQRVTHRITERGKAVCGGLKTEKYLQQLVKALPITNETRKTGRIQTE